MRPRSRIRGAIPAALATSLAAFALTVLLTFLLTGYFWRREHERTISLLLWPSYLAPRTLENFTEKTGIHVQLELFDSNEALLAKIGSGNVDYDVICPSDYMVDILVSRGLVAELDRSRIPNLAHLEKEFVGLYFDPEGRFSVPYLWGTCGIGYRTDHVPAPDSWNALWDPAQEGRIGMLDDVRETMGVALKRLGASVNTTDPAILERAAADLAAQKSLVKEYNSSSYQELLVSGEAWMVHGWSGQIAKAAREFPYVGYSLPREGTTRFVDNFCIPKSARHVDEAHQLIDYMLDPAVSAEVCAYTLSSTPSAKAKQLLPPEVLANPAVFPPADALARCEYIRDVGDVIETFDMLWTSVKSR